ncbi:MAG: tetratricopeptide repeat protein [Actinomycetota bacterium]
MNIALTVIVGTLIVLAIYILAKHANNSRGYKLSIHQIAAQRYVSQGRFEQAKFEIERAIEKNPSDSLNYYALGVIYYNLKEHNKALKNLKQAVLIDRNNWDAWFLMGRIYYERYDNEKAIKYFDKALCANPSMIKAHFGLASILFERGQIQEAAEHYRKIISIEPMNANAHYNLGSCLIEEGRFREAIKEHEISAALDSENPYAYYWVGYSYMQLNDKKRAAEAFAKSLQRGYEGAAEALKSLV